MGPAAIHDSMLRDGLDDAFSGKHSGWHTEDLVAKFKLMSPRARRLFRSFSAALLIGAAGQNVQAEIVGVPIKESKVPSVFEIDEAPRTDTTLEKLAKLKPAFRQDGHITAGNAPASTVARCPTRYQSIRCRSQ